MVPSPALRTPRPPGPAEPISYTPARNNSGENHGFPGWWLATGSPAWGWWDVPIPVYMKEKREKYEKEIEEEDLS